MAVGTIYTFGPFELDAHAHRLTREHAVVAVSARHLDVLVTLVARAGTVISKDTLVEAGWREVAVTDNSLEQAVSALRRAVGAGADGQPYIQTVPRQGYKFVGEVTARSTRVDDEVLDGLIAPHRAWVEGRAALETLSADRIAKARVAFEQLVAGTPDDPLAHIGMANANVMHYETTRADEMPDRAALTIAAHHAREACRLDPSRGEAWATRGFVLDRTGHPAEARAALTKATALEPDNWRHHFRLALVSWGEERLREARRALALLPGLPLAHFLTATVLVARQTFDDAQRELEMGLESMSAVPRTGATKFPGVGLEWLLGLILLARGADDEAQKRFERELGQEGQNHLYTRECCAQAWYAIGAMHVHHRRYEQAVGPLRETVARLRLHPARFVLASLLDTPGDRAAPASASSFEADTSVLRQRPAMDLAVAQALRLAMKDDHVQAAAMVEQALTSADPGSQGWLLPVEPMLRVSMNPRVWASVLALLRSRAA